MQNLPYRRASLWAFGTLAVIVVTNAAVLAVAHSPMALAPVIPNLRQEPARLR